MKYTALRDDRETVRAGSKTSSVKAAIDSGIAQRHSMLATLLGLAARGASRATLAREIVDALAQRGTYGGSAEDLTPIRRDALRYRLANSEVSERERAADQLGRHLAAF